MLLLGFENFQSTKNDEDWGLGHLDIEVEII